MPHGGAKASMSRALPGGGTATEERRLRRGRGRNAHREQLSVAVGRRLRAAARVGGPHASGRPADGRHGSAGIRRGQVQGGADVLSEAREGGRRGRSATTRALPVCGECRDGGRRRRGGSVPRVLPPLTVGLEPEDQERGQGRSAQDCWRTGEWVDKGRAQLLSDATFTLGRDAGTHVGQ